VLSSVDTACPESHARSDGIAPSRDVKRPFVVGPRERFLGRLEHTAHTLLPIPLHADVDSRREESHSTRDDPVSERQPPDYGVLGAN
jgi:hypothetical protein